MYCRGFNAAKAAALAPTTLTSCSTVVKRASWFLSVSCKAAMSLSYFTNLTVVSFKPWSFVSSAVVAAVTFVSVFSPAFLIASSFAAVMSLAISSLAVWILVSACLPAFSTAASLAASDLVVAASVALSAAA